MTTITMAGAGPLASIVVPAHNEEAVLGAFLDRLAPLIEENKAAVYVVCNGCTDATARVAGSRTGVNVYELAETSKVAALRQGDRLAGQQFPRLYLDADIVVSAATVERVIEQLRRGPALAAAPTLRVECSGRPWLVRGFYEFVMSSSPWVRDGMVGSGFYGLSEAGRARFGQWPDVINDDLFVRELFGDHERLSLADDYFSVEAPRTTWALVRAKARVHAGTRQLLRARASAAGAPGPKTGAPGPKTGTGRPGVPEPSLSLGRRLQRRADMMLKRSRGRLRLPRTWGVCLAHSWVRSAAVVLAWSYEVRGANIRWGQDRTTRDHTTRDRGLVAT